MPDPRWSLGGLVKKLIWLSGMGAVCAPAPGQDLGASMAQRAGCIWCGKWDMMVVMEPSDWWLALAFLPLFPLRLGHSWRCSACGGPNPASVGRAGASLPGVAWARGLTHGGIKGYQLALGLVGAVVVGLAAMIAYRQPWPAAAVGAAIGWGLGLAWGVERYGGEAEPLLPALAGAGGAALAATFVPGGWAASPMGLAVAGAGSLALFGIVQGMGIALGDRGRSRRGQRRQSVRFRYWDVLRLLPLALAVVTLWRIGFGEVDWVLPALAWAGGGALWQVLSALCHRW